MNNFPRLIGMSQEEHGWYNMYFRCTRGFKYTITVFEASGIRDFFMCASVARITKEEFDRLPYQVEEQPDGSMKVLQQTKN